MDYDTDYDTSLPGKPGQIVAHGGRRLALQRSEWLTTFYVPYSPRNENGNAEGLWEDWVTLAHDIIRLEETRRGNG